MPEPKIYRATAHAVWNAPAVRPLSGSQRSAQNYADKITTSGWWARHCPGWARATHPAPGRVWVEFETSKGDTAAYVDHKRSRRWKGRDMPVLVLGDGEVHGIPVRQDKWVILHELAHVMTHHIEDEGHHGRQFLYSYLRLVREFLGQGHFEALVTACKESNIKLNYRKI